MGRGLGTRGMADCRAVGGPWNVMVALSGVVGRETGTRVPRAVCGRLRACAQFRANKKGGTNAAPLCGVDARLQGHAARRVRRDGARFVALADFFRQHLLGRVDELVLVR